MKTIAVVEDNADNRLLHQSLPGDTCLIAENEDGPGALAGLRSDRPVEVLFSAIRTRTN